MNDTIRTQLTQVFTDHTALMQATARQRVSREEAEKRRVEAFHSQFAAHTETVILPLFEEVGAWCARTGKDAP